MTDEPRPTASDLKFNPANLYREESFTDLRVGTLRRLIPVKPDGAPDPARTPLFSGEATIMTQAGPIPLHFPIEANTLQEAMDEFPRAVNAAVQDMLEEARELQRREASRIVVPGQEVKSKLQLP